MNKDQQKQNTNDNSAKGSYQYFEVGEKGPKLKNPVPSFDAHKYQPPAKGGNVRIF